MLKVARTSYRLLKGTFSATSRGRIAGSRSDGKETVMMLPERSCDWWKKRPVSATVRASQMVLARMHKKMLGRAE
jgi:hypothetical protein